MKDSYRPILKIPTTQLEHTYDQISIVAILGMVVGALWSFLNLPDIIPIHWNIIGEADGFGSKYWIALLPTLAVLFYYGKVQLVKIPHKYNYVKRITPDNAKSEYIFGRKIIRLVHLLSQLVFFLIFFFTIKGALSGDQDMGIYTMLLIYLVLAVPLILVVRRYSGDTIN